MNVINTAQMKHIDAILLDDDPLIHQVWLMAAKKKGKNICCFSKKEDLFSSLKDYPSNTPIYIDSNLGENEQRGEEVARELYALGFTELYLATGYAANIIQAPSCIKRVVGKAPTFDA